MTRSSLTKPLLVQGFVLALLLPLASGSETWFLVDVPSLVCQDTKDAYKVLYEMNTDTKPLTFEMMVDETVAESFQPHILTFYRKTNEEVKVGVKIKTASETIYSESLSLQKLSPQYSFAEMAALDSKEGQWKDITDRLDKVIAKQPDDVQPDNEEELAGNEPPVVERQLWGGRSRSGGSYYSGGRSRSSYYYSPPSYYYSSPRSRYSSPRSRYSPSYYYSPRSRYSPSYYYYSSPRSRYSPSYYYYSSPRSRYSGDSSWGSRSRSYSPRSRSYTPRSRSYIGPSGGRSRGGPPRRRTPSEFEYARRRYPSRFSSERRRAGNFGWDGSRNWNPSNSKAGTYGFSQAPYPAAQATMYGYSGYHGYQPAGMSSSRQIYIAAATGFVVGGAAGVAGGMYVGSRYRSYDSYQNYEGHMCSMWDGARFKQSSCSDCGASSRCSVQHAPKSSLNRDDIIQSGFYPNDYYKIVIEITSLSSSAWPVSSVCPPKGETATTGWVTKAPVDLYLSLTKVESLNDVDTSGDNDWIYPCIIAVGAVLFGSAVVYCIIVASQKRTGSPIPGLVVSGTSEMREWQPRPSMPIVHGPPNGMPPPRASVAPPSQMPPGMHPGPMHGMAPMGGPGMPGQHGPPGAYPGPTPGMPPMGGPRTPVHPDLASGFIGALWGEYVLGRTNGVGHFFDGCPPQDANVLEPYEDQIRSSPDHANAIRGLAVSWGLPPPY